MKLKQLIKKGENQRQAAERLGISHDVLRKFLSQDREVLKLADGNYVVKSKQTIILRCE